MIEDEWTTDLPKARTCIELLRKELGQRATTIAEKDAEIRAALAAKTRAEAERAMLAAKVAYYEAFITYEKASKP